MTNNETSKKMGSWDEDGTTGGEKLKNKVVKYLKEGKNKLLLLEDRISGGKNVEKLMGEVGLSKKKLLKAKQTFEKYEKKAEQYIEKNPKKAVAIAAAAGVLVGGLLSAFKGKKPVQRKKRRPLPANSTLSKE
jgi:ElaB/YqjD/DUF883 family membrane-anchored ribosome-binding protein